MIVYSFNISINDKRSDRIFTPKYEEIASTIIIGNRHNEYQQ